MSKKIFDKLMTAIGNEIGVCVLLGNMQAESEMISINVQNTGNKKLNMTDIEYTNAVDLGTYTNFVFDSIGYGLCQWTSSGRKQALYNFAKNVNASIGNEDMQVDFVIYELNTSYKSVLKKLKVATSIREASDIVCKNYERPKDKSEDALKKRAAKSEVFYNLYCGGGATLIKPVDYKQYDTKWGKLPYAVDGESSTIKSAGCGPTAVANVLASLVSPYIDPVTTASWSRMKGYKVKNSGTAHSYIVAQLNHYGVKARRLNTVNVYHKPSELVHLTALEELKKGNWLIACMGKGLWTSSGHYITVYGYENSMVYINDPASSKSERAINYFSTFANEVKYYWVVEVPDSVKVSGIVKTGNYSHEDFVREVQYCTGSKLDGKQGPLTLAKTVTVSQKKNNKHDVVLPLQKFFHKKGLYTGSFDKIAGKLFDAAVKKYQGIYLGYSVSKQDGEITAGKTTWKSILGMI